MFASKQHKLSACGKTYTFTIGGGGCDKRSGRTPIIIPKPTHDIYCFGQDSISLFNDNEQVILTVADGHGSITAGKTISYKLHDYIIEKVIALKDVLLSLLRTSDEIEIKIIMDKMFGEVNDIILNVDEDTRRFNDGGSTFTLVHKIIDDVDGSLYTITSNVGDSPHIKIEDGIVNEITEQQNCDNIDAVERYCNNCMTDGIEPTPVILGRINHRLVNGTFACQMKWMGSDTIKPYNYTILPNGKYKVEPNYSVMQKLYETAPDSVKRLSLYNGGPQSIRERPANILALESGNYPMENFGSTLNGSVQSVSSFGDKLSIHNHNIMCIPSVCITKENGDNISYDFITTDGGYDCLTNENISELFKDKGNMEMEEIMRLIKYKIDKMAREGQFPFRNDYPVWDDLSYWVVSTTKHLEIDTL